MFAQPKETDELREHSIQLFNHKNSSTLSGSEWKSQVYYYFC